MCYMIDTTPIEVAKEVERRRAIKKAEYDFAYRKRMEELERGDALGCYSEQTLQDAYRHNEEEWKEIRGQVFPKSLG